MKMLQRLSGRKFDAICKRWIQRTIDRTKVLRRRSETMQSFLITDIEELLRRGSDSHAYSKAEEVCAERNRISCYKSVTQFCECILSHLSAMQKEREFPKEYQEAVSSLIFAAERIPKAPELIKLRDILKERYGNPLKSFVNEEFAAKLESKSSSEDMKLQLLRDISQRLSIGWDSRGLESELFNINPPASSNKDGTYGTTLQDEEEIISPKGTDAVPKEDQEDPSERRLPEREMASDDGEEVDNKHARITATGTRNPWQEEVAENGSECMLQVLNGRTHNQKDETPPPSPGSSAENSDPTRRRSPDHYNKHHPSSDYEPVNTCIHKPNTLEPTKLHLHPKLPDYINEVVAELAAIEESQRILKRKFIIMNELLLALLIIEFGRED